MKKLLFGLLLGLLIPFAAGYVFVISGGMPVAASAQPLPLEHYIAHVSIHAAMGSAINRPPPIAADQASLSAGARVYRAQCAICHGAPEGPASATARGMFPPPPALVRADRKGVTDDSAGETFWKVKNGIRMTGMPGYDGALSDTEIWQVSLLLQRAHSLPPRAQAELMAP